MKMQIHVMGKTKEYYFDFDGHPDDLQGWWDDGLDIAKIVNEIPVWVASLGLVREWCWLQDLFCKENRKKE